MSIRNLEALLRPRSVAVIGASTRPGSVGSVVLRNLLAAGFEGPVMPVNPKHEAVGGVLAYQDVAKLPVVPDLAVICTPPAGVPDTIARLGARGTRAAAVLTAGLHLQSEAGGRRLDQAMLDAARPHLLRVLGPNCVGLIAPGARLNASFAHAAAAPGSIAFLSQSGAMCTAVLDWAGSRGIGFSCFVSVGDALDIDFGDLVDFLGSDPTTRAILLYMESVGNARKFLSAVRAAARNKPVVAIKAGRGRAGGEAAASHTRALAGADDVVDYALRRAGVLRVDGIDELFDAVETIARARPLRGERLAVLTNGGGPGVMAVDALCAAGGQPAELTARTIAALASVLPASWCPGHPVDVLGDADGKRLESCARILAGAPEVDAVLVLFAPTAVLAAEDAAAAVIAGLSGSAHTVLTSFLGGTIAAGARRRLAAAGLPSYETPGDAVRAFLHMTRYRRNQEILRRAPPRRDETAPGRTNDAEAPLAGAVRDGREWLGESEAKQVLAAYGIPVVPTAVAADAAEAAARARECGFPVAVKLLSPDLLHKSDIGGVSLDLETPAAVEAAAAAMARRLRAWKPEARLTGFTVQPMARRPGALELFAGAAIDPVFGPFVVFGHGGVAVEVLADRAVAIPPLDLHLARDLIAGTRVWRLLRGFRNRPPADVDAIARALVAVSRIVVEHGEVLELDVNPLLADERGVLALDARIRVGPARVPGPERLAIRPYPKEWEEAWTTTAGRRVLLRPIRPDDEPAHREMFRRLTPEDVRFRFFRQVREFAPSEMARYTQIDYDREIAFIAEDLEREPGATLAVGRAVCDPDNERADFALLVRPDVKGQGIGRHLLEMIIAWCRARNTAVVAGRVLDGNAPMLSLARALGFEVRTGDGAGEVEVVLALRGER